MVTSQDLRDRASEFTELHFRDMSLMSDMSDPSIIHPFLVFDSADGPMIATTECGDEFDIIKFNFVLGDPGDGFTGECNTKNMTITIAPEFAADDSVLLHEMIHAFEYLMEKLAGYSQLHDVMLLCLYNDLKSKIPDLDMRIIDHAHLENGVDITEHGGRHDILFLLKSFDLDLRLNLPLGSVCGYGRDRFSAQMDE